MSDEERKQAELEKAQRQNDDDEEGEGEEETEEGEKSSDGCGNTAKSEDLTEDDLEKSLDLLTDFVEEGDAPTRKEVLLEKAQQASLSKSERQELFDLLGDGGSRVEEDMLVDEVIKAMEPTENLQKALDVSDFLNDTHEENKRVTSILADRIEKSDTRQHEFNLVLAKAVTNIGNLIKSVDDRLSAIEGQPARKPKSQAKPLEKSFANTTPGELQLSKSEILNTMSEMIAESCDQGMGGVVNNIDLVTAAAKYEQVNAISPTVLSMVQQKRSAVH